MIKLIDTLNWKCDIKFEFDETANVSVDSVFDIKTAAMITTIKKLNDSQTKEQEN